MPALQKYGSIVGDQSVKVEQFASRKAAARVQRRRLQPELRFVLVTLDMHMWRFVRVR
jgi:hypothetical protein